MSEIRFGQPRGDGGLDEAGRAELERLRRKQNPGKYEPHWIRDEQDNRDPDEKPPERVIIQILGGGDVGGVGGNGRRSVRPRREKPPRPAQGEDVVEPIRPIAPTGERRSDPEEPGEDEADGNTDGKDAAYDRTGKILRRPRTGRVIHKK